jgi:thiosulfate reductase cytochrome b subunit
LDRIVIQPGWVRVTHWLNALAVVVMASSGWAIYNASPVFPPLVIPRAITLGGWLGGALLWHFAAMWLLVANFVVYVGMNLATGRFSRRMLPVGPAAVLRDVGLALRGRLDHGDLSHYNAVQKTSYLFVVADIIVLIASGLAIWKSVQLPWLRIVMGGYDQARVVHFVAMALLVAFVVMHVVMVALVPRSLRLMIAGR